MKKMLPFLGLCFSLSLSLHAETISFENVGFATPESVEYDQANDLYLVSNIHGSPLEADGNGFISKLSPEGKVIELKWIEGDKEGVILNAPKGMEIVGEHLYVTDLDTLRIFELKTGKPVASHKVLGSTFLNGITKAGKDSVYVTDSGLKEGFQPSGSDAIYQIHLDGSIKTVLANPELGRPNGIVKKGKDLYVVTFGSGEFFKVDAEGQKHDLPKPEHQGLDGLVVLKDGSFLFSSWGASGIYKVSEGEPIQLIQQDLDAPADMAVDTKRSLLLVPLFKQNKVLTIQLK